LFIAQEWQQLIDSGQAGSTADLARHLGVTRAHVTQVLRLLHLSAQVQQAILALGGPMKFRGLGGHTLRALAILPPDDQVRKILTRML